MNNADTIHIQSIEIRELKLRLSSIEYLLKSAQISGANKLIEYALELAKLY